MYPLKWFTKSTSSWICLTSSGCRILWSPDLEGKTGKWALKWRKRACRNGGENPVTCDLWKTNIWKSRTTWRVWQLQQWIAKRWDRIDRISNIFQLKRLKLWKTKPGSFQSGPGLFKKMSVILLLVGPVWQEFRYVCIYYSEYSWRYLLSDAVWAMGKRARTNDLT